MASSIWAVLEVGPPTLMTAVPRYPLEDRPGCPTIRAYAPGFSGIWASTLKR